MTTRPFVQVFDAENKVVGKVRLPSVLTTPIRPDLVNFVHTQINKNDRQAYGAAPYAGEQTSAESWGTGRAVARIPRVPGSGTHRSGQGAFGNMCRGGRMYGPNKTWRRWNRKVNVNQKRYAVVSALAASAVPALVMARGHRISGINEVPLVIANESIETVNKTKAAVALLKKVNAYADVEKVIDSKHIRAGAGKSRNRRYKVRKGPLVVTTGKSKLALAFRNIPGVEIANVQRLNLLKLAPGGHLGRFIIWTKSAFEQLDQVFGTFEKKSTQKKGYTLPRPVMANADVVRLVSSDEIQAAVNASKIVVKRPTTTVRRSNPLKNVAAMVKLNPAAVSTRRTQVVSKKSKSLKVNKKNQLRSKLVGATLA
ncbi:60S ribosomal protein L4 [Dictyostelium purpureum]|uniref:60S ribosomal protein L4 n=1 Tax=Dictyostelium purpureum TaxID=5786 RepID=F0ZM68_DICPU|nr:60S ribosomal protein L4 [Dictyostelium purpureum]EGC34977.1 60S ribosomal protein L4 [Dictyostelium purpureum]|eukprot:XP_003288502.1 60S ribosomal protein L4 [Dictyostelium purpureum]